MNLPQCIKGSHVIAVLYNLKFNAQTGKFMLFTACTSKPQTWHNKSKRRDLHECPIKYYKVTNTLSEKVRKNKRRDLSLQVASLAEKLDSVEIEQSFLHTFGNSKEPSVTKGGLDTLLSHRYIKASYKIDHSYGPLPSSSCGMDHS